MDVALFDHISTNDLFTLGKAYMSFGDGQFDQGVHLLLDEDVFKPLVNDILTITKACPAKEGEEDCGCGEACMGAVETFILKRWGVIENYWTQAYDSVLGDRADMSEAPDTSTNNRDLDGTMVYNEAGDGVFVNPWELVENAVENAIDNHPLEAMALTLIREAHELTEYAQQNRVVFP